MTIQPGAPAPAVAGVDADGPRAVVFFKVTCPTCQMAARPLSILGEAYPGHVVAVGQDPEAALESFARSYGFAIASLSDPEPYPASSAYDIEHVPTVVVIGGHGLVVDVVESWDRSGLNRAARALAEELGMAPVTVSSAADGLPDFRPG
jgi:peroxiredoxin